MRPISFPGQQSTWQWGFGVGSPEMGRGEGLWNGVTSNPLDHYQACGRNAHHELRCLRGREAKQDEQDEESNGCSAGFPSDRI